MLLTIEKVLILKSVSIFSQVRESALADVASTLQEIHLDEGQELFAKGDTGSSLYIVVEGSLRVHDGTRTIATLGSGEVVGELAAIDPEPRMASVTALEPALLLRMEHLELYELITQYSEVSIGILRVLCRRLRNK